MAENMQNVVSIRDSRYPKLLKSLGRDAPKQLYYKGEWPACGRGRPALPAGRDSTIFENCLAVVGSRRMSSYGRQITEKLVSEIAGAGLTIVSGFMYGIDVASHKAALEAGGRTIAVMPCGIDLIHPDYQEKLYQDILKNKGLVVSEYSGDFLPTLWTYPRRNRIVAGLSKAVMVIEAGEKSGSLITANFAKKLKRKVFVVPGPLTSVLSKGINQLIKQGAEIVTGAGDILEYYNIRYSLSDIPVRGQTSDDLEQRIIQELQKEPMEIDGLARILGIQISEMGTIMSMMQIKGLVFSEKGKYYVH